MNPRTSNGLDGALVGLRRLVIAVYRTCFGDEVGQMRGEVSSNRKRMDLPPIPFVIGFDGAIPGYRQAGKPTGRADHSKPDGSKITLKRAEYI
jgi:hypothetical protein